MSHDLLLQMAYYVYGNNALHAGQLKGKGELQSPKGITGDQIALLFKN